MRRGEENRREERRREEGKGRGKERQIGQEFERELMGRRECSDKRIKLV